MPKSFLQHLTAGGAPTWVVAFPSYADSHPGPRSAGFRFDGSTQSWRTVDASAVARLALAPDSIVEAVAATITAFEAQRSALPSELRDAPLVLVDAAPVDPVAARRQAEAEHRAALRAEQEREWAEWLVERERQAASEEEPSGADASIVLRLDPEGGFFVRHAGRGRYAPQLRELRYVFREGIWSTEFYVAALRLAADVARDLSCQPDGVDAMPATLEAARELARFPADEIGYMSGLPRLVVVSTEAEEDVKDKTHRAGAKRRAAA